MHCYSLTERVMTGIVIHLNEHPHVLPAEGCPFLLMLDKQLTSVAERVPPNAGVLRLDRADVGFEQGVLVLKPARGGSRQALVRIETAGGDGGRVFLAANVYDEELIKGHVKWKYQQFPPLGINALAEPAYLEKAHHEGVEILDLFVIMSPGSSFRIRRTGRLEGASPELVVQWTGRELRAKAPKRYDARELVPLVGLGG